MIPGGPGAVKDWTALDLAEESQVRAERNPLDFVAGTKPQEAFWSLEGPEGLWRDGNQMGKSFAQAVDINWRCTGTHPYVTPHKRPPYHVVVASVSYEQMIPLMQKLWETAPKHWLEPTCGYEAGRGLTGRPPRLVYRRDSPGRGSTVTFATYKAGTTRIAGYTVDDFRLDEPPPESYYGEVRPRIMRRRGILRVTMTPGPDMPPQDWYRKRVARGRVQQVNYGLTEENVWPRGYPAPWLYQDEIDEAAADMLPYERAMRLGLAWSMKVEGAAIPSWSQDLIRRVTLQDVAGWWLVVGIDHGASHQAGKQAAVLLAVSDPASDRPRVAVLGEAVSESMTTPEHDAEAILALLASRGLHYDHVDQWVGDVPTGSERYAIRKSNRDLRKELARQLGRPLRRTRKIDTPRKWSGSRTYGTRLLNALCHRQHFQVDPQAETLARGLSEWDGDPYHPLKDVVDAARYATERGCRGKVMAVFSPHY